MSQKKSGAVCNQLTVRCSKINQEWDEAIGKAIEKIPVNKLPTQRVILQRFRAERTKDPEGIYSSYN